MLCKVSPTIFWEELPYFPVYFIIMIHIFIKLKYKQITKLQKLLRNATLKIFSFYNIFLGKKSNINTPS